MRSLFAAISGLLSLSLVACGAPPEGGEAGAGDDALPPLARAFDSDIQPQAIAAGPDGDVLLTGTFANDVDFGGGTLTAESSLGVFLAHLDAGGEHLWSGSTGSNDDPRDVAIDPSGDQYVVGYFEGQINFGSGKMAGDDDAFFAAFTKETHSLFERASRPDAPDLAFVDLVSAVYDWSSGRAGGQE